MAVANPKIANKGEVPRIKKNIINLFNKNIEGALLGTPREIVTTIRSLQKDILKIRNVITDAEKLGELTAREMAKFKSSLFKKLKNNNPKYYNMLENNQYIKYSDGKMVTLDAYNEMATRTTILNIERDGVEAQEIKNERRISGYMLRDERTVIKARETCKRILNKKYMGHALLAHDSGAAEIFGCWTIDEARAAGAMGPNCRHSLYALPEEIYNTIDRVLFLSENEVA